MKKSKSEIIRWIFWLGVGVAIALAGCAPSSLTTTPPTYIAPGSESTAALDSAILTAVVHSARPLPIYIASIIRRDDDAGWRHYWATSSQQVPVNALAYDGQWLWIATAEGMIRLDPDSLEYELFSSTGSSPDIALDQVYTLIMDDQGQLWAGGVHGLVRYSKSAGWKVIYTEGTVSQFALDKDDNLWILSYPLRGVPYAYRFRGQEPPLIGAWRPKQVEWKDAYLDPANWRLLVLGRRSANEGSVKDANGNTWSWSHYEIYYNGQLAHLMPNYRSYNIAVARAGMWIGTEEGLFYSDGQTLKPYQLTDGKATANYPRVDSLAFTADGSGWVTTPEGLFHFSEDIGKWEPTTGTSRTMPLEERTVTLVASTRQNSLWAYGYNNLAHFDGQSWQHWPIPDNVTQLWVQESSVIEYQGDLWLTDRNRDLWRFDGQTWSTVEAPEITNLAQDHTGRLFAANRSDSIFVYDGTDWQPLPDCVECGERYDFSAISVDASGNVWGTYESGIWRYSTDAGWREILKFDRYTLVESPLTDAHGDFWFRSGGVVRCGLEDCEVWGLDRWGGPITALAADAQGRSWIGGYGLLSVYDPAAERQ